MKCPKKFLKYHEHSTRLKFIFYSHKHFFKSILLCIIVSFMNLDVNSWARVILISYQYNLYTTVRHSDRLWMQAIRHTNTLTIRFFSLSLYSSTRKPQVNSEKISDQFIPNHATDTETDELVLCKKDWLKKV